MKIPNVLSLLFLLFIWGAENTSAQVQQSKALGILIKFTDLIEAKNPAFSKLKATHQLDETHKLQKLKIIALVSQNKAVNEKAYADICEDALKIKGITHCELNQELETDDTSCGAVPLFSVAASSLQPLESLVTNCELLPAASSPHAIAGLSTFWAQEYTGADLLRQRIIDSNFPQSRLNNLFGVWDSPRLDHGARVSNLIQGPHSAALIPGLNNNFSNTRFAEDFLAPAEECLNGLCPQYINNSQATNNIIVQGATKEVLNSGTVFIRSAGNSSSSVLRGDRELARTNQLILVSSLSPTGFPSEFTNYAPEVTISAPSNFEITSYNSSGEYESFGGTSGAAPQVTAVLAAFTLITGYPLDGVESTRLLRKTALPIPGIPAPHNLGAGMLNTYRIGDIAYRINELCPATSSTQHECIKTLLSGETLYGPVVDTNAPLASAAEAFPQCASPAISRSEQRSCQNKRRIFKELRRSSFLNPSDPEIWRILACILRTEQVLTGNADYYAGMENHLRMNQQEQFERLLERDHGARHASRYLPRRLMESSDENMKLFEDALGNGRNDSYLFELLLADHWQHHPSADSYIEGLIARGNHDSFLISNLFIQPYWQNHPKFFDYLSSIQKRGEEDRSIVRLLMSSNLQSIPNSQELQRRILREHAARKNSLDDILIQPFLGTIEPASWITTWIRQGIMDDSLIELVLKNDRFNRLFSNRMNEPVTVESLRRHAM